MNGQVDRYILLNLYYLSKGADAGSASVCASPTVPKEVFLPVCKECCGRVSLVMNVIIPTMNYLSNRELSVPESHPPQECPHDQLKQGSGRPLGQILWPLNHPHLLFMTELAETSQLFALCLCCVPHCSPMEITPRHASQKLAPVGQRSECAHLTHSGGPACCCSSFLNG